MKPMSWFRSPSSRDRHGTTTAGCLAGLLRHIVCLSSLPLCSFDHFKEEEREKDIIIRVTTPALTSEVGAGVVAGLMGVDEQPLVGQTDSFKTLRSPRKIPAYRELEDENFFILSFEKPSRRKSRRNSCRRENKVDENAENLLPTLKKNTTKLEEAKITCENEGESENTSPNSVLEFVGFSADQESASPGEISRLENPKVRRPLSGELESCRGGNTCSERLEEVGKMASMDAIKSSWSDEEILQNKHCLMEIGRFLESNILDYLLEELLINLEYNVTQVLCL